VDNHVNNLLDKVKANLILTHNVDDELLQGIIHAALDYAITYQKRKRVWKVIPPVTEQAVIMLASHWFESRDGGTGGFFADNVNASQQILSTVNRMLSLNKHWEV